MSWFKVDDTFPLNPKVLACPLEALGLWVTAGAWCAQQLTDGYVPKAVLPMLRSNEANASILLQAGLWERVEGGYQFHDWNEYQPSSSAVRERRKQTSAKRSEAGRKGGMKSGVTRRNKASEARSKREANGEANASILLQANAKQTSKQNEAPSRPDLYITPSLRSGVQGGDDSDEPHLPDVVADAPTAPETVAANTAAKGTRLPDGWGPSRTPANLAVEDGHSPEWLTGQLDRFRDYWAGVAGQRGRKRDWDATWRNWLRRSAETPSRPQGRPATGLTDDEWQDAYSRAAARDAASVDDASRSNARQSLPMLPRSA
ncbi:hypothetical protein FYJ43_04435 [Cutibacterium sp. WCA-380-WT-3A]|uniref:DUF1376 domain-containing protein n=1 Tax=Cutibacterium porci TaxID=2605781 RepID=A0A7K0J5T7_9ACTN|nr:hypothetical protein [Cutibacterium porci]MSS45305.1 hypothetical protein [Cutibacterium porci]